MKNAFYYWHYWHSLFTEELLNTVKSGILRIDISISRISIILFKYSIKFTRPDVMLIVNFNDCDRYLKCNS